MSVEGRIRAINISQKKGVIKTPVPEIVLTALGLEGDAHAGRHHRQISLLAKESVDAFIQSTGRPTGDGEFAENITTEGLDLGRLGVFDRLTAGTGSDQTIWEITQIGKHCHGSGCAIYTTTGDCVMPREGLFARVLKPGRIRTGDALRAEKRKLRCRVITLSDRASTGEYEDRSGPDIEKRITDWVDSADVRRRFRWMLDIRRVVIPDEADVLRRELEPALSDGVELVFTTGGTGIGPRDITPDVVREFIRKEIPGIMEQVRLASAVKTPSALLSRGVAGTAGAEGKTLVFTLPGSPKAVAEYLDVIQPLLAHTLQMVHGLSH